MNVTHAMGLSVVCVSFLSGRALAHTSVQLSGVERYIKVEVAHHRVRVVVSLTHGVAATSLLLARHDVDHNGVLGDAEATAARDDVLNGATEHLTLRIDGRARPLKWQALAMEPVTPTRGDSLVVEGNGFADLELEGEHEITLRDQDDLQAFVRTEIAMRTKDGVRLLASGLDELQSPPRRDTAIGKGYSGDRNIRLKVGIGQVPRGCHCGAVRTSRANKNGAWLGAVFVALGLAPAARQRRNG